MDNQKIRRRLGLASTLLWLWGAIVLAVGFAVGYAAYATKGTLLPLLLFLSWGVAVCHSAIAMRKARWGVRWWGAALCALAIIGLLLSSVRIALFGIALNAFVLWVIVSSWSSLASKAEPMTSPSPEDSTGQGA
jgi:hypothetical protein